MSDIVRIRPAFHITLDFLAREDTILSYSGWCVKLQVSDLLRETDKHKT